MIKRRVLDSIFDVVIQPAEGDKPKKKTNSISFWKNGKEVETYHIISQMGYYQYDCWDVKNGEMVTLQLI